MALSRITVENVGEVAVVTFIDRKWLDDDKTAKITDELAALIEKDGRRKIVLDFRDVEYLGKSAEIFFFKVDRKAKAHQVALRLCNVGPSAWPFFTSHRLDRVFDIHDSRESALRGL